MFKGHVSSNGGTIQGPAPYSSGVSIHASFALPAGLGTWRARARRMAFTSAFFFLFKQYDTFKLPFVAGLNYCRASELWTRMIYRAAQCFACLNVLH